MTVALIIAGGSGQRMNQDIPKQFLNVNDIPVIIYTLKAFQNHPEIDEIAVVCIEGWETMLFAYARQFGITKLNIVVPGGESGQESIRNGIFELKKHFKDDDIVLVHDAIRPMVSDAIITDCIEKTKKFGNAIAAIPCAEAMVTTKNSTTSNDTYPRSELKRTQTPQGFKIGDLCEYHNRAIKEGITNSVASVTLAIELGETINLSLGSEKNIKLTTTEDLEIFRALLQAEKKDWIK